MFNFEEYEKECERIREVNEGYLEIFAEDMSSKLKPATISRHLRNIDMYINIFLLHEEPMQMEEGVFHIDFFLGYFFIRKCGWSTPRTIKTSATSIKKFYKCMMDHGKVSPEQYECLCLEIKELLPEWQQLCAQYNDPNADNPFLVF